MDHSTYHHMLTLRGIIEEARHKRQRVYCCFVDFCKAFDTVSRARLIKRLQELGYDSEVIGAVVALYERVTGHQLNHKDHEHNRSQTRMSLVTDFH